MSTMCRLEHFFRVCKLLALGPKVLLVMDTNLGLATQSLCFLCACRPDLSLSEAKDVTLTENGPRFTMRSQQPNLAQPIEP